MRPPRLSAAGSFKLSNPCAGASGAFTKIIAGKKRHPGIPRRGPEPPGIPGRRVIFGELARRKRGFDRGIQAKAAKEDTLKRCKQKYF